MTSLLKKIENSPVHKYKDAAREEAIFKGRVKLEAIFHANGIKMYDTGIADANHIEDWTTLMLWMAEKGFDKKTESLAKDDVTILIGALCVVAESLLPFTGESKAFAMFMAVNGCNRQFFNVNPMRPTTLYELARKQRNSFFSNPLCRRYLEEIADGVKNAFESKDEDGGQRAKIASGIKGLLKIAASALPKLKTE